MYMYMKDNSDIRIKTIIQILCKKLFEVSKYMIISLLYWDIVYNYK
jgi:hypothetical protein